MRAKRPDYLRALQDPQAPAQSTLPGVAAAEPVRDQAPAPPLAGVEDASRAKYQAAYDAVKQELVEQAPANVIAEMNWALFDTLVSATLAYRTARESVIKYGEVIKSPSGYPIQSPYVSIMNKQAQIMARTSAELGLTLAARLRAKTGSKPASKTNPFAGLKSID